MKSIVKKYLITTASLFLMTQAVPAFSIAGGWNKLLLSALILFMLFNILRPVINLIMLPVNLLTLNFFSWIIQVLIFYLWTIIVRDVKILPWQFPGLDLGIITVSQTDLLKWQVIIFIAFIFILLNKFLNFIFT